MQQILDIDFSNRMVNRMVQNALVEIATAWSTAWSYMVGRLQQKNGSKLRKTNRMVNRMVPTWWEAPTTSRNVMVPLSLEGTRPCGWVDVVNMYGLEYCEE